MLALILVASEPWSRLTERWSELAAASGRGVLALLIAIGVLLLGWLVARVVVALVRWLLRTLRFDAGVRRLLGPRVTGRHEPTLVAGRVVSGVVMAAASMLALETLGLRLAAPVAERLSDVVPRIVTAAVIFAVGFFFAKLISRVTRRFLESADVRGARLQSQIVSIVLSGFAVLLALEQLGFAAQFVMAIGIAAVAAAGLGLALAFGLGCRELARDFVIEYLRSFERESPDKPA